jgi:leucine dehydrogenase
MCETFFEAAVEELDVPGYEKVLRITEESTGLLAIICIHDTTLGPALGGTRIRAYPSFEAALTDVKRLAKGMSYKSAMAETGLGGGKSVIILDPRDKTPELLTAFAEAVNSLGGLYTCAEDMGCTLDDVTLIGKTTPYVTGLKHAKSSGNPSPFTAWGTFRGIQSVLYKLFGTTDLTGRTVAIQGLGSVGEILAETLFWHGAHLILSDLDWEKTMALAKKFHAEACPVEDIMTVRCDVLSPCAMGGILNSETIPQLNCSAVAGCANNQLLTDADAELLFARGILYAPDFVINAGGLINVTSEIDRDGYNPRTTRDKTDRLYDQLLAIYTAAEEKGISTHRAAVEMAEHKIRHHIGKRHTPVYYHHAESDLAP